MWTKVWLIGGLESEVPESGAFIPVTSDANPSSWRAVQTSAFVPSTTPVNTGEICFVHAASGHVSEAFQCAYHDWRYNTTGTLKWVYCEEGFPQGSPCGKRNLIEIPCETWAGLIWYTTNEDAKPLREFLHPIAEQLDCYRMERMRRTHWVTLEGEFNWKCVQDNFNESYSNCQFDLYPSGHARMFMPGGGPNPSYQGSADDVFAALGVEIKFWELDPEPYRDNIPGLRTMLQAQKRK